mgnify:CR=1 FL=1
MAYREVTMLEVKEVLRLWLTGVRKKRIAAQLGLNVKTVRRYLRAAQEHGLTIAANPDELDDGLLAAVVSTVQPSVKQGGTISEPLKVSQEFPPMVVQMITVGEASGTLDTMLAEIADHYDELVRHGLKRLTALIEPVFLMIMGGMVAFIMASVLLPLFRMVNVIR